ncbi:hypothetical protein J6590_097104 [Homalodisca vitripennis]|nr:hypothetical protein J6590_097104 [Homalodisca vitripennis]
MRVWNGQRREWTAHTSYRNGTGGEIQGEKSESLARFPPYAPSTVLRWSFAGEDTATTYSNIIQTSLCEILGLSLTRPEKRCKRTQVQQEEDVFKQGSNVEGVTMQPVPVGVVKGKSQVTLAGNLTSTFLVQCGWDWCRYLSAKSWESGRPPHKNLGIERVKKNILKRSSDGKEWEFGNKLLGQVGDPLLATDGVNLQTFDEK